MCVYLLSPPDHVHCGPHNRQCLLSLVFGSNVTGQEQLRQLSGFGERGISKGQVGEGKLSLGPQLTTECRFFWPQDLATPV